MVKGEGLNPSRQSIKRIAFSRRIWRKLMILSTILMQTKIRVYVCNKRGNMVKYSKLHHGNDLKNEWLLWDSWMKNIGQLFKNKNEKVTKTLQTDHLIGRISCWCEKRFLFWIRMGYHYTCQFSIVYFAWWKAYLEHHAFNNCILGRLYWVVIVRWNIYT